MLHCQHEQPFGEAKPSQIIATVSKGPEMEKQVLWLDESKPKKATRADRPPTEGFVMVVDGHLSLSLTPSRLPKHRQEN
jgi:hypothetical protein